MTGRLLIPMPGNAELGDRLAKAVGIDTGTVEVRRFPDGETYVRLDGALAGRSIVLVCSLDRPDDKLLPLLFTACTARELGAASVGLVAPYLAYLRQDRRFSPGEAVTSSYFAQLLSRHFDWLVTVDPHLHRLNSLSEIYSVPAVAVRAAPLLSEWIAREIANPVLIGPDSESDQWVAAVARGAGAPYVVLEKTRRGDREVEISVPQMARWMRHTPVLVDDIVSTGRTMIETIRHLKAAATKPPVCVAIHGLFAGTAYAELRAAGARRIVSANTIAHESNGIDVTSLLARSILDIVGKGATT